MRNPIRKLYPITIPEDEPRVVEAVFLTTLRGTVDKAFIDVTMNASGDTHKTFGPFSTLQRAQRAERHLLLNWQRWFVLWVQDEPVTTAGQLKLKQSYEHSIGLMWEDCKLDEDLSYADHLAWMTSHPLPIPSSENMQ